MNKHTPGPWYRTRDGYYVVVGGKWDNNVWPPQQLVVDMGGHAGVTEMDANTQLVAAAPDLLAALEKCEALALSDDDPEDLLEEVRIAAHAAIALAKGKA